MDFKEIESAASAYREGACWLKIFCNEASESMDEPTTKQASYVVMRFDKFVRDMEPAMDRLAKFAQDKDAQSQQRVTWEAHTTHLENLTTDGAAKLRGVAKDVARRSDSSRDMMTNVEEPHAAYKKSTENNTKLCQKMDEMRLRENREGFLGMEATLGSGTDNLTQEAREMNESSARETNLRLHNADTASSKEIRENVNPRTHDIRKGIEEMNTAQTDLPQQMAAGYAKFAAELQEKVHDLAMCEIKNRFRDTEAALSNNLQMAVKNGIDTLTGELRMGIASLVQERNTRSSASLGQRIGRLTPGSNDSGDMASPAAARKKRRLEPGSSRGSLSGPARLPWSADDQKQQEEKWDELGGQMKRLLKCLRLGCDETNTPDASHIMRLTLRSLAEREMEQSPAALLDVARTDFQAWTKDTWFCLRLYLDRLEVRVAPGSCEYCANNDLASCLQLSCDSGGRGRLRIRSVDGN